MILDRLTNAEQYRELSPRLWQGLEFLRTAPLLELEAGRHAIDGDKLFALVQDYTTKLAADCQYEAHRKHWDIQVVAKGSEQVGWAHVAQMKESILYSEERDVAFFTGQGDLFTLLPGMFAVFLPQDVHMPCLQAATPEEVRKVVVKVAISA
jgi:YhcH/YjgK/YiaL family protein